MNSKSFMSLAGMQLRGINLILDDEPDGRVRVRVDLHVPSSTTGEWIRVSTVTHFAREQFSDEALARDTIKQVVLSAVGHEVDEWLRIDGVRRDPHTEK